MASSLEDENSKASSTLHVPGLIKLTVKWKGVVLEAILIESTKYVLDLKLRLMDCTGIEVKNQKLLLKGRMLKDDDIVHDLRIAKVQSAFFDNIYV